MLHSHYTATFTIFNRDCVCHKNFQIFRLKVPVNTQRLQKGNRVIKKCVLVERQKVSKITSTESETAR